MTRRTDALMFHAHVGRSKFTVTQEMEIIRCCKHKSKLASVIALATVSNTSNWTSFPGHETNNAYTDPQPPSQPPTPPPNYECKKSDHKGKFSGFIKKCKDLITPKKGKRFEG
jgi:hypothetical protein